MADNGDRSMLRRVHDATCPGAVANLKPVQRVCPVCRAAAQGEAGETDEPGGASAPTDPSYSGHRNSEEM